MQIKLIFELKIAKITIFKYYPETAVVFNNNRNRMEIS